METYNIVSQGTLTLYGRVFNNFANGDVSQISFPNDLVKMTTGKGGNTIFSKDESGRNATATIRLIRGSSDDQFLQSKLSASKRDFASTELAFGEFVIRLGDGAGKVARDVFTMKGGMITKPVDGKENTAGDTEQGVVVYTINFADCDRSIQ